MLKRCGTLLRKLLVLCLTFSLLNTMLIYAAGANDAPLSKTDIESSIKKDFPLLLWNLKENPSVYGLSQEDLLGVKLLSPVRFVTNETSENELASEGELYALHFPMINTKGKIFAIYTIIKTDNHVNATMGVDFAVLLERLKNEGVKNTVLVQNENGIIALTENGRTVSLNGNESSIDQATLSLKENFANYPYVSLNLEVINEEYSDKAEIAVNKFSLKKVETNFIEGNRKNNEADITETSAATEENSTRSIVKASGSATLANYPIVDQKIGNTQYGLCWAATVASMCRFEKPLSYASLTAQNVADYMGVGYNDGGTNNEAKEALSHYLGAPYSPTITGVLSDGDIKTVIDNVDPAYTQNKRKTGFWPWSFDYHAVALIGYSFTSSGSTIQIMDPAYETIKTATKSGSTWSFSFGDTTFSWTKTIRLLYKN